MDMLLDEIQYAQPDSTKQTKSLANNVKSSTK